MEWKVRPLEASLILGWNALSSDSGGACLKMDGLQAERFNQSDSWILGRLGVNVIRSIGEES